MGMLFRKFLKGEETLQEDIQRNLGYLLRAKRGAASFHPQFGLSETGFRTAEEMLVRLGEEIRENIRLFEPRIELIDIEEDYEAEGGRARLVVNCRLKDSKEPLTLVFSPQGRTLSLASKTRPSEEE
jgi:predicted component of type VI protein secretion system